MDQIKTGKFIAECRKKANLTQMQLAEKLGIKDRAISKWENGKAIRVKTRHQQMTSEGIYTGGPIPFGYHMVDKGRKNKKGRPAYDLAVDPKLRPIVEKLFSLVVDEGYGNTQIAEWLNKQGYKTAKNAEFQASNVHRILKNEVYRGYFVRGNARSERMEDLQIISDHTFFRVQEILEQRSGKAEEKRTVILRNKSTSLLGGNIFCAHCGGRMIFTRRHDKYPRKDGTVLVKDYGAYMCYHRTRRLNDCDGGTIYIAQRIDDCVLKSVHSVFEIIAGCPEEETIRLAYNNTVKTIQSEKEKITQQLTKDYSQLEKLRAEIANALTGDSVYSSEDLSEAIQTIRSRIKEQEERLEEIATTIDEKKRMSECIIPAYRQFRTWALEFDEASLEAKRMIISELFSRIEIGRGYKVHCELNVTYKQFCTEWATLDKKINAIA